MTAAAASGSAIASSRSLRGSGSRVAHAAEEPAARHGGTRIAKTTAAACGPRPCGLFRLPAEPIPAAPVASTVGPLVPVVLHAALAHDRRSRRAAMYRPTRALTNGRAGILD